MTSPGATLGYTVSKGKLGLNPITDVEEDVVLAAIGYTVTPPTGSAQTLGAGHVFQDQPLSELSAALLPPAPYQNEHGLGTLGDAVGNCVGTGARNMVFLGEYGRDGVFSGCTPATVAAMGAVQVFDVNHPVSPGSPIATIAPPNDPGNCAPCASSSNCVGRFGHGLAIGDVDGDGINDLAVGAQEAEFGAGRVYVFFGNSNFLQTSPPGYLTRWVAFKAPIPAGSAPTNAFGVTIQIVELDGQPGAEVVVASYERRVNTGRVSIFRGASVANIPNGTIVGPTGPGSASYPQYQELAPGPAQASISDTFGWQIFPGDLRGDGRTDLAIWTENIQPPLSQPPSCGEITPRIGALFIYTNVSATSPTKIMETLAYNAATQPNGYFKLTSSIINTSIAPLARFGRGATVCRWKYLDGVARNVFFVGEPGAYAHGNCEAGKVHLYELTLNPGATPVMTMDGPNPSLAGHFGASMVALRYNNILAPLDAEQLVISGREESPNGVSQAGRAYSFIAN
ncbi:MAG: FG-GAP repeat protein [Planctomycetes bacterium]|nr:FG-GAP repeat protein [Planctomycetota bacterium]